MLDASGSPLNQDSGVRPGREVALPPGHRVAGGLEQPSFRGDEAVQLRGADEPAPPAATWVAQLQPQAVAGQLDLDPGGGRAVRAGHLDATGSTRVAW